MRNRRILLIPAGLVIAAILAFFLQDVTRRVVVTPLAYFWWGLKLLYSAAPQLLLWILLLVVLFLSVITSLLGWISIGKSHDQKSKPVLGPVEVLAGWVSGSTRGNYFRWTIAHRLGKLAQEISGRKEAGDHPDRLETASGRRPPEAVQRYLKAGLDESFVDYPLPALPFTRRKETPFDLDVEEALKYLESQMEARIGQKRS